MFEQQNDTLRLYVCLYTSCNECISYDYVLICLLYQERPLASATHRGGPSVADDDVSVRLTVTREMLQAVRRSNSY